MPQKYNSIIFDLGGVLYDIDFQRSHDSFAALGLSDFNKFITLKQQVQLFDSLEKGQIGETGFVAGINNLTGMALTHDQVKQAWNALLIRMPEESIALLKELRKEGFNLYLLSNTNIYHYDSINVELKDKFGLNTLADLFDAAYYSFQVGMRKPDVEIYQHVINSHNLQPDKTVFIDDNEDNLKGAIAAGISAVHKPKDIPIREVIDKWVR